METYPNLRDCAIDELTRLLVAIDEEAAVALADEVLRASRIFATGAGRSGLVVRGYAMRLMHLGLAAYVVGEVTTPAIGGNDLLLAASGSGRTRGVLQIAQSAQAAGARVACITTDRDSPLARLSDRLLVLPASHPKSGSSPHAGTIASAQPLGSLFEQSLWLFCDIHVALLKERLGETEESLFARHANLE